MTSNDDCIRTNAESSADEVPLWKLMERAYVVSGDHANTDGRCGTAAEIEALRDWLVPLLPYTLSDDEDPIVSAAKLEGQRLRALLTEQARIARNHP